MRKPTMTFVLLAVALFGGPLLADESKPADSAAVPTESGTAAARSHEVEAEVVAVDGEKNTITLKTTSGESTAPVDSKAHAALSGLKPGQKVTVVCRDDDKGEHKAVAEIKTTEAPAEKPAP